MVFADHFSTNAAGYAAYRPTYPHAMVRRLAELAPATALAWDCGTGNGQAAVLAARHFERVVATDLSREQLRAASHDPRVEYRLTSADASGLDAGTVDLVTVAQALHWFDLTRFYAEADRVLKPDGLLAVWCYGRARIDDPVDAVLARFHAARIDGFWPPERRHIDAGYRTLPFPYPEIDVGNWVMSMPMSRERLIGYVGTWSAIARARRAGADDPLLELERLLDPVWRDAGKERLVTWPIALRAGRRQARLP